MFVNGRPGWRQPNGGSLLPSAMTQFETLVAQWECFDEAACQAEERLERALDAYCLGGAPAPAPDDIAAARRLRFIARHRLRWMLYQTCRARAGAPLL